MHISKVICCSAVLSSATVAIFPCLSGLWTLVSFMSFILFFPISWSSLWKGLHLLQAPVSPGSLSSCPTSGWTLVVQDVPSRLQCPAGFCDEECCCYHLPSVLTCSQGHVGRACSPCHVTALQLLGMGATAPRMTEVFRVHISGLASVLRSTALVVTEPTWI